MDRAEQIKSELESRGYLVGTKGNGIGGAKWGCTIFIDNKSKSFRASTETQALQQALWYAKQLEREQAIAQARREWEESGDTA